MESKFHSPLARNASVQWSRISCNTSSSKSEAYVDLFVKFEEVDWESAQKFYGWSAFQYHAWVKGHIFNHDTVSHTVSLFSEKILELWVNDLHVFGGDFFGFGRAPIVAELRPGLNNVSVRLVREVRSMGGVFPPTTQATLRVQLASRALEIVLDSIVLPDVVNGRLCSSYGSIIVRNQAQTSLTIVQLIAYIDGDSIGTMYQEVRVGAGQSRPLKLLFDGRHELGNLLDFELKYSVDGAGREEVSFSAPLNHANVTDLQKITFVHPSGVVSYATLRPPPVTTIFGQAQIPVLLNLHGAGVEASGPLARHMFDDGHSISAWVLTPTGMSPWSSDDWHSWAFADANAAVLAVSDWMKNTGWSASGVYTDKLLVAGHSNGGQGTWYFATHQPDKVLGAAALSGYSSIENYVPYTMWTEADALLDAILRMSRASFRHEVLLENLRGTPILQQHGSADDNVPAYHSRLMDSLLAQSGQLVEYSELLDKGHWFEGAMTTRPLMQFYNQHLNISEANASPPSNFVYVVPNSHDMGSKFGLVVDQLSTPDRMGQITVESTVQKSRTIWHLKTANVHRFHYDLGVRLPNPPDYLFIDDTPHAFGVVDESTSFVHMDSGIWALEAALNWKTLDQRYGRQRGPLDAILQCSGPFEVVYDSNDTLPVAVQVSRNMLQYYGADANLNAFSAYGTALEREGNVVTLCIGSSLPRSQFAGYPIHLTREKILLTLRDQRTVSLPLKVGMGGIWLRPLPNERLELVVWGYDLLGLRQAARLIPTITGAGVPDFVILSDEARWKGHAGTIAMGFLDHNWQISSASYVP